jgi:hypothetical protein
MIPPDRRDQNVVKKAEIENTGQMFGGQKSAASRQATVSEGSLGEET